ncbi:hypothetical protein CEXT_210711 [Caerostris extrusa]|uniref:Uncharacterized protein n=1 Tax=Caerostris extrusa TaxID=172846 RepID=A0AAV4XJ02_CAEEX|nr:hypothetical protein CEXT_210711 [Caerostris extrusa]
MNQLSEPQRLVHSYAHFSTDVKSPRSLLSHSEWAVLLCCYAWTPPPPPFAGTLTPVEQLLGPRLGEGCVKRAAQGGPGESSEEQQMAPAAEVPAHQLEALLLRPPAGRPQLHALPHRRDEREYPTPFPSLLPSTVAHRFKEMCFPGHTRACY